MTRPQDAKSNHKAMLTKIHRVIDQYERRPEKHPDMQTIMQIVGRSKKEDVK